MYVVYVYDVCIIHTIHEYTYTGDMAWHVSLYSYLALGLPGCHFLNIFASKVSRKNKGKVSNFFGQSDTNDTSTPGWVPLHYSTTVQYSLLQFA